MRHLVEHRATLSLGSAAIVGAVGVHMCSLPADDPVPMFVTLLRPALSAVVAYLYATVMVVTPLLVLNRVASLAYIFPAHGQSAATAGAAEVPSTCVALGAVPRAW